tara:strand:- start:1124 stop:1444 length:321 start_codon:yes stop_codon:yes gene_type:complete
MAINLQKKSEGVHYEMIPSAEHEQAWHIRILEGQFTETIIQFGAVSFNEIKDNMSFNFEVISSPNDSAVIENEELQIEAGEILEDVIANSIQRGSLITKEIDANKN